MYQYKFSGSQKPIDTRIHSDPIPGYINFVGHDAADADGNVDWTKWDCIDPDTKTLVAVEVVEPDPYVETLSEKKAKLIAANLNSYNTDVASLRNQLLAVMLSDGDDEADNTAEIRADFSARKTEYLTARAAILAMTE